MGLSGRLRQAVTMSVGARSKPRKQPATSSLIVVNDCFLRSASAHSSSF